MGQKKNVSEPNGLGKPVPILLEGHSKQTNKERLRSPELLIRNSQTTFLCSSKLLFVGCFVLNTYYYLSYSEKPMFFGMYFRKEELLI